MEIILEEMSILKEVYLGIIPFQKELNSISEELTNRINAHEANKTLDVKIYCSFDNEIELRFDLYTDFHSPYFKEFLPVTYFKKSINDVIEKNISLEKNSHLYSITFQLPTSPHLLLSWLSYLSFYLEFARFNIKNVTISCEDKEDILYKNDLFQLVNSILLLENKIKVVGKDGVHLLMGVLKSLTENDKFNMFHVFFNYQLDSRSLSGFCKGFYDSNANKAKRVETLCTLSRSLIGSGQKDSLNAYFNWVDFYAKRKLFSLCVTKKLPSQKTFSDKDIEWNFLEFAEFKYINKRVCINNIQNNPAYSNFYAENCFFYKEYEMHIRAFFDALELDFEPDCDLRSQIIFTAKSSEKLLHLGMCLKDECQKNIYIQNHYRLFTFNSKNNERISPYSCPKVVIDEIFNITYSA